MASKPPNLAVTTPDFVAKAVAALERAARRFALTEARAPGRYASKGDARVKLRLAARACSAAYDRWQATMTPDAGEE